MSDKKKMSQQELRSTLKGMINDAIEYVDDELGPQRTKATQYYKAELFGNESDGRSQFVMSEVRDTVLGIIPGLLRVIFGPEHVVEYAPRNAQTVQEAAQVTDYARYVFEEDNAGLLTTYNVLVDGLVRRIGIFKWGVDDTNTVKAMSGHATESQIEQLLQDDGFKLTRVVQTQAAVQPTAPILGPDGQQAGQGNPGSEAEYDIEFTYTVDGKRIWIMSVPTDEFIYNREARTLDTATLVGHKRRMTTSELVALGISPEVIEENGGDDTSQFDESEVQARQPDDVALVKDPDGGESNKKHLYIENYVRIDFDGDKINELRKVCTLGPNYYIVENEPANSLPFSVFTPIPEPHTMLGQSYADLTMDIQLLKSSMIRATQDSAAAATFPRIGYVEGHVSVADIMNDAIAGPIRMRQAGDVQPITIPYIGEQILSLIRYTDEVKENRTGQAKGAIGLDADALQSTEKAAAGQIVSATQAREEVLARIFAEQALKPMFRGILELIGEIHPKKQMIKMRGQWTEIDPEIWSLNLGVSVSVMLGTAAKEQKLAALEKFTMKQEMLLTTLGPQNPIASLSQYANTLRQGVKLLGFPDVDSYFSAPPADYQPPPPPQPPPDPKIQVAQIQAQSAAEQNKLEMQKLLADSSHKQRAHELEMAKVQQEGQLRAAELTQKHVNEEMTRQNETERLATETAIRIKEMELKHETELSKEFVQNSVASAKEKAKIESSNVQTAAKIANEKHLGELKAHLEHERTLAEMKHKHAEAMKPEPKPEPKAAESKPQPIQIDNHIHMPTPKGATVSKGKDGKTRIDPDKD